jgi:adenylosuccinate lyase
MRRNLDLTGGRLASERILLALVDNDIAREDGYRWVQRCALAEGNFRKAVAADPDISRLLSTEAIEDCFDERHALEHVQSIIDRALEEKP